MEARRLNHCVPDLSLRATDFKRSSRYGLEWLRGIRVADPALGSLLGEDLRLSDILHAGGGVGVLIWPEIEKMNDTLLGVVLLVLYNFVEPLMLATMGTTPFKALLRIRVRNDDGSKPSYFRALSRTFSVWLRGQGVGIPIAALVTSIMSYSRLKNEGITSWDQSGGFTVSHQTIQWWRWLVLLLLFVGFVALMVVGSEV